MGHVTEIEEPIDWWLVTRTISGEVATSAAFDAILGAEERLRELGRSDIRQAFTAIVEGTWWVAALDEQLRRRLELHRPSLAVEYVAVRDVDEDGQYIRAFLWARNRHSHQLPFSTAFNEDLARLHGGVPSRFSEELLWIASDEFPQDSSAHKDGKRQAVYDRLLAEQPINRTLYHCALWLNKAAGRDLAWAGDQAEKARGGHAEIRVAPDLKKPSQ